GFDPVAVLVRYSSAEDLLDSIVTNVTPRGQVRRGRTSCWPLFTQAVLSGARFLAQFSDVADFTKWASSFHDDGRSRAALPLLLGEELTGFGFALACDFLKELGFANYAKPDVHVRSICRGLSLCPPKANDFTVFKSILRIAAKRQVSPYHVD